MRLILALAVRNAIRNRARTTLTAASVLLGTMLLTMAIAWLEGIFGEALARAAEPVGHVRIVDPDYAQREDLFPLDEALSDVTALAQRVAAAEDVVSVHPRLQAPALVGDVRVVVTGADEGWYRDRLDLDAHLVRGALGEAVVGSSLAVRLEVDVGDELIVLGRTWDGSLSPLKANVAGIAQSGSQLVDQGVFLDLERVRWLADLPDGATELLVYGESRDGAGSLRRSVEALGLDGVRVEAWSERDPWRAMLDLIGFTSRVLTSIILGVTALGVFNTMTMAVLERQTELGVLRAMGMSRAGVVALFVLEAVGIAAVGGLLGALLGSGGALWLETTGITFGERVSRNLPIPVATTVYADFQLSMALAAFALGLMTAAVGSALPAVRAAWLDPVEAIRENR